MKKLNYHSTLFYYDGPQVIEARDAIGGHYVGVMVNSDRYLVVGVSPGNLAKFKSGNMDLRTLLLTQPDDAWYISDPVVDLGDAITLVAQSSALGESAYLPDAGFILSSGGTQQALQTEPAGHSVTLTGVVEEADIVKRSWRLATADRKFSGKTKDNGPSLLGIRLGHLYRFACTEEVEETQEAGAKHRSLRLIEYTLINE